MRVDFVKVASRVSMEFAPGIEHDRRDPNGGRSQRLDIVQLLFNPFEIASMNRGSPMTVWIVIAIGIVIRRVSVEEAVGNDLIDALSLPEIAVGAGAHCQLRTPEEG
jgi:hypothetical protein